MSSPEDGSAGIGRPGAAEPLDESFFARDATLVAPELLGKRVVVGPCAGRITEVEAYTGDDPASHAHRGQTPRNAAMFGPAGRWYVYFTYGMHHCANVITGAVGDGQGVLVRAVEPLDGIDVMRARRRNRADRELTNGPGKFAQAFGLDLSANGTPVTLYDDGIVLEVPVPGPRIGISKAVDWPRRWVVPAAVVRSDSFRG